MSARMVPKEIRPADSELGSNSELARRFGDVHNGVSRVLDLCASLIASAGAAPRLSAVRDCVDGSVQLSLRVLQALPPDRVQAADCILRDVSRGGWAKLCVHNSTVTRTFVICDITRDDLPLASRMVAEDDGGGWTAVTWKLAAKHDAIQVEELRATLTASVESFWLGRCPELELHIADSIGNEIFSLRRPPDFVPSFAKFSEQPTAETTLLQAVRRAGSATARGRLADAIVVSGWNFPRGQAGVQCCMHWCPDEPGADCGQSSIVRLLTTECFQVHGVRPVHEAFAAVAKTWTKEFAMKLTPRNKLDHSSYWFEMPSIPSQPSASGVLTLAIDSPGVRPADATESKRKTYLRAVKLAVGQAVDALAAQDLVFLSQRRRRRQKYAPCIAQKLSWMLCKLGNERVLNECAFALGVDYDQLAADSTAIATGYQQHDNLNSGAAGNASSSTVSSVVDSTPHSRLAGNISAGIVNHLCAQLREKQPDAPDSNKVANTCRQRSNLDRPATNCLSGKRRVGSRVDNDGHSDELRSISAEHSTCTNVTQCSHPVGDATPTVDVESDWTDSESYSASVADDIFESDNWSDEAWSVGAANAFESDDWSDSAPNHNPAGPCDHVAEEGERRRSKIAFSEGHWNANVGADAGSDFSSSDSDDDDDPCKIEAAWALQLGREHDRSCDTCDAFIR